MSAKDQAREWADTIGRALPVLDHDAHHALTELLWAAIKSMPHESSACAVNDFCVEQGGHVEPCRSVLFSATGEPR